MTASFLTTIFFALSALFATRTTRLVGGTTANFCRQWVAIGFLALWAHGLQGAGLRGAGFPMFVLSGIVGFGFADLAMYCALPLLGSRLTALMVQCLAAPFAAGIEWLWLGTTLTPYQLGCGGVILLGVGLAVAPSRLSRPDPAAAPGVPADRARITGLFCGAVAAIGQAGGAVLSRKANLLSRAEGFAIDGGTAAYQRLLGGLLVVSGALLVLKLRRPGRTAIARAPADWKRAWPWILANGLAGPVMGVSCYQWALATTPSALVLPIVALTPLVVIPFAFFMENERPSVRSLLGGALAVAAAAALARIK